MNGIHTLIRRHRRVCSWSLLSTMWEHNMKAIYKQGNGSSSGTESASPLILAFTGKWLQNCKKWSSVVWKPPGLWFPLTAAWRDQDDATLAFHFVKWESNNALGYIIHSQWEKASTMLVHRKSMTNISNRNTYLPHLSEISYHWLNFLIFI